MLRFIPHHALMHIACVWLVHYALVPIQVVYCCILTLHVEYIPLLNVDMKTIEDEGDQGSIKMQWINLYEKTGLCYGWQDPYTKR